MRTKKIKLLRMMIATVLETTKIKKLTLKKGLGILLIPGVKAFI